MAILSIKRYLNNPSHETMLRHAIALLVQKLGACAIDAGTHELENFLMDIDSNHDALTSDLPHENVLILAESAARAFERYNRQTVGAIRNRDSEFQRIIRTLQAGLLNIAGENTESARGLSKIGEELEL